MDETTDIAEAQTEDPGALRKALIEQMAYLVDEIEALETVVEGVPDQIMNGRPAPDALTMKELYGAIATLDEDVRPRWIEQTTDEDSTPSLASVDVDEEVREAGWNEQEMDTILDRVKEARRHLVEQLEDLPLEAWHRTVSRQEETLTLFQLVHGMTQEDVRRLRDLGYRLHGAHLSDRDEPLPT